jgi:hypothetical protein
MEDKGQVIDCVRRPRRTRPPDGDRRNRLEGQAARHEEKAVEKGQAGKEARGNPGSEGDQEFVHRGRQGHAQLRQATREGIDKRREGSDGQGPKEKKLKPSDFKIKKGIDYIRIDAEAAKMGEYREVPLHNHLIAEGLLTYKDSRKGRPLFYDPGRSRGGKEAGRHFRKAGEHLARWIRSEEWE